jgi:hypothetical protein
VPQAAKIKGSNLFWPVTLGDVFHIKPEEVGIVTVLTVRGKVPAPDDQTVGTRDMTVFTGGISQQIPDIIALNGSEFTGCCRFFKPRYKYPCRTAI